MRANFRRAQRWENYRQFLVLSTFTVGAALILAGLVFSIYSLLSSDDPELIALSKWILETLLGALLAGLIAFWAVKSFEK